MGSRALKRNRVREGREQGIGDEGCKEGPDACEEQRREFG